MYLKEHEKDGSTNSDGLGPVHILQALYKASMQSITEIYIILNVISPLLKPIDHGWKD